MTVPQYLRSVDLVARRLHEAGCRFAFGIPGGEVLTLIDALEVAGIDFVLCKHENGAGFIAEGVHHRTGAPAVLVTTLGPGALNAVNVVENARQDRVPLIVLTGQVDGVDTLTYTHQVVDHRAVFGPITKQTFTLIAETAETITDKAVAIATSGRPGPVHIDVPISTAGQVVTGSPPPLRRPPAANVPASGPDLALARSWIAASERPIIVAGQDAVADRAGPAITAFAERHRVPVITTYKGKGLIPETHPLSIGAAGLSPLNDGLLLPFIGKADLIICAGYDPIEMRHAWRDAWDPSRVRVIDVASEPNEHYVYQAGLHFVADIGATLTLLSGDAEEQEGWRGGEIPGIKAKLDAAFCGEADWGPAAVIDECRRVLPESTLASADSGAHRILLSHMWKCAEPRALVQSSGLCTMGCAVPLAIGMQLVERDRQVVAFTGDAGLLMVAGELATASELGVTPTIIVFVDDTLALIEKKQAARSLPRTGVRFGRHDYAGLAKSLGGRGVTVRNRTQLEAALVDACASDRFTLIAADIEGYTYDDLI